jgi:hypothetical protein
MAREMIAAPAAAARGNSENKAGGPPVFRYNRGNPELLLLLPPDRPSSQYGAIIFQRRQFNLNSCPSSGDASRALGVACTSSQNRDEHEFVL